MFESSYFRKLLNVLNILNLLGTYHIFPAKKVEELLNICKRIDNIAYCSKSFDAKQVSCESGCLKEQVRTLCAERANNGEDILGICIATFYKIEKDEN